MTVADMIKMAKEIEEDSDYSIGIRFENKLRKVGDICEYSKDNSNRDDPRDFPDYDSEEYDSLPFMSGTSAYYVNALEDNSISDKEAADYYHDTKHCYIVEGYGYEGDDDGEVVIENAKVLKVIF